MSQSDSALLSTVEFNTYAEIEFNSYQFPGCSYKFKTGSCNSPSIYPTLLC